MKTVLKRFGTAILSLLAVFCRDSGAVVQGRASDGGWGAAQAARVPFVENVGQIGDDQIRFRAVTFGGTVSITRDARILYVLPRIAAPAGPCEAVVLEESLADAAPAVPQAGPASPVQVNVFRGGAALAAQRRIPAHESVVVGDVYEGIRLELRAYGNNVEKVFCVSPGADPARIRVRVAGADAMAVSARGELAVKTALGEVCFTRPVAYQDGPAGRALVDVDYVVDGECYGFAVGPYDRSRALLIDPLLASTYVGGSSGEEARAVAVDGNGNVFVAGWSSSYDFPSTPGAYRTAQIVSGNTDAFIAKFAANGTNLLSATYLASANTDIIHAIDVGANGEVYVAGEAGGRDFPVTAGAFDVDFGNWQGTEAFVSRLDNSLSNMLASTFLGGQDAERAYALWLSDSGQVYVAGETESVGFPTTPGAYRPHFGGFGDWTNYTVEVDVKPVQGRFQLNFCNSDQGSYIADVWEDGRLVVAKSTESSWDELATAWPAGLVTGVWHHLAVSVSNENISVYLDGMPALAVQDTNYPYYRGGRIALSTPVHSGVWTSEAYVRSIVVRGERGVLWRDDFADGDLAEWNTDTWGTLAGGGWTPVQKDGETVLGSYTYTYTWSPEGGGAWASPRGPGFHEDGFVAKLDAGLGNIVASTFLGGVNRDTIRDLALDGRGNVYVCGETESLDYPTDTNAFDRTAAGDWTQQDISFRAKVTGGELTLVFRSSYVGGNDDFLLQRQYVADFRADGANLRKEGTGDQVFWQRATDTGFATGVWHDVRVVVAGPATEVRVDGTVLFSVVDEDPLAFGSIRIHAGANDEETQIGTGDGVRTSFAGTVGRAGCPVAVGTVRVHDGVETLTDPDGDGVLSGDKGGAGTVDYGTGAVSVNFAQAPAAGWAVGAYCWWRSDVYIDDLVATNRHGVIFADDFEDNDVSDWNRWDDGTPTGSPGWQVVPEGQGKVFYGRGRSGALPHAWHYSPNADACVSVLDADLATLRASTFLGDGSFDTATALAVGADGSVYVGGGTESHGFPATRDAYMPTYGPEYDQMAYVAKLNGDLSALEAATFLGDSAWEQIDALALAGDGDVVVAGSTWSTRFPTTDQAYDRTHAGERDAFVARLNASLSGLEAATLFGGGGDDKALAVCVDEDGSVLVAGRTRSVDLPVTNASQVALGGYQDAYLARFDADLTGPPRAILSLSTSSWNFGYVYLGSAVTQTFTIVNRGQLDLDIGALALVDSGDVPHFSIINDRCSGRTVAPRLAETCTVQVVFAPSSLWGKAVVLQVPSGDAGNPTNVVRLYGSGCDTGTAESLFQQGLEALRGFAAAPDQPALRDEAYAKFREAVNASSAHYGASVCAAVTRVWMLDQDPEIQQALVDAGLVQAGGGILSIAWDGIGTIMQAMGVLARFGTKAESAIDDALAYLDNVPTNWTGSLVITPDMAPIDSPVQVDGGDVQMLGAILHGCKGVLHVLMAHNLDFDPAYGDHTDTPRAAISVDGSAGDWTGIRPLFVDERGDGLRADGVDIDKVYTAMDGSYAYFMVQPAAGTIASTDAVEAYFNFRPGQQYANGGNRDDLRTVIVSNALAAWVSNDVAYAVDGVRVANGAVFEAAIPLAALGNPGYFAATFVNVWPPDSATGDDPSEIGMDAGAYLEQFPDLGIITNAAHFATASNAFVLALERYLVAADMMRSETDFQTDDLFIFDPADSPAEHAGYRFAQQARDSLLGRTGAEFAVELGRLCHLGYLFSDPVALREVFADGRGVLVDHVQGQAAWAVAQLGLAGTNFNVVLSSNDYPIAASVEVDYGDIAMARAVAGAAQGLLATLEGYDAADIPLVGHLVINEVLAAHPGLLAMATPAGMVAASHTLALAMDSYMDASAFVRAETDDQSNDVFVVTAENLPDHLDLVARLGEVRASLAGPVFFDPDGVRKTLHGRQFFTPPYVTRAHLPRFTDGNEMVENTFPDPTFNGVFPRMTQWQLAEMLGLEHVDTDVDGMADLWEMEFFSDLTRDGTQDFDGDGLLDFFEYANRTQPKMADRDNDGHADYVEVINGTDTADDASRPGPPHRPWTRIWGSSRNDAGWDVAVDPAGNVYVAGRTESSFHDAASNGGVDMCLTKFDAAGNRLWTRLWGSARTDEIGGVCVAGSNAVYVAGGTRGSFDSGTNAGSTDACLIKFDGGGNRIWSRMWGSELYDMAAGVAADAGGNAYVIGHSYSAFDSQSNQGGLDAFLVKFAADGTREWTTFWGSTYDDNPGDLCVDPAGNAYVAGETAGSMGGQGAIGEFDAFLVKLDAGGAVEWTRVWGSAGDDEAEGVCLDGAGRVYVAGEASWGFDGQDGFGDHDVFLTQFEANGYRRWTRLWGTPEADEAEGVAVDGQGFVYCAGGTYGMLGGEAGRGACDAFLLKVAPSGNAHWTRVWGSAQTEAVQDLAVAADGAIYVAGSTYASFDAQRHAGSNDCFVTKWVDGCGFAPNTHYVSLAGGHVWPFTNWRDAATNVQCAVDAADDGDLVLVTNGTYRNGYAVSFFTYAPSGVVEEVNRVLVAKGVMVRSVNGPVETVLDGLSAHRCLALAHSNAVVSGFTITGGYAAGGAGGRGGGVVCYKGGTVQECRIVWNMAEAEGGGVYCLGGGLVRGCEVVSNTVFAAGGGVSSRDGGTLRNCVIAANEAFAENANARGAGVYASGATVENCTICDNRGLPGTTFLDAYGGGIYCASNTTVKNTIVYDNAAANGANVYDAEGGSSFSYSCTAPAVPGTGNITNAPRFADTPGDYHLKSTEGRWCPVAAGWVRDATVSPCVDAGDPASEYLCEPAPRGSRINMGAYGNTVHASMTPTSDTDGDRLPDWWELKYFDSIATSSGSGDRDLDGKSDAEEYGRGTHPGLPDAAAGGTTLAQRGSWPGYLRGNAEDVFVTNNLAYVAMGKAGLVVFDVSQPASPVRIGSCVLTNAEAWAVWVANGYAYVAGSSGLKVIDVNNPTNLVVVGEFWGTGTDVRVLGNVAYLGSYYGLEAIDVTNPRKPASVGQYPKTVASFTIYDVAIQGGYAYLAAGTNGMIVVDVRNSTNLTYAGSYPTTGGRNAIAVDVVGDHTYLSIKGTYPDPDGFCVLNVGNPAAPTLVGSLEQDSGAVWCVHVRDGYAFLGGGKMEVIDVRNPSAPVPVAPVQGLDGSWSITWGRGGLAAAGNHLYGAFSTDGLVVFDVSNVTRPVRVGGYRHTGSAVGVEVVGSHVYLADEYGGLRVIDASDPDALNQVTNYKADVACRNVWPSAGHVFAALDWGVDILDVANPANPVSRDVLPVRVRSGVVSGRYGYAIVDGSSWALVVFDLNDPVNPVQVGSLPLAELGWESDMHASGGYVYLADTANGLRVFDVRNPAAPAEAGGFRGEIPGLGSLYARGVYVEGGYAFVACEWGGLAAFSVTNPAAPAFVANLRATWPESPNAADVVVSGSRAYVADGRAGVQIVDVSDPAHMVRLASAPTAGEAEDLRLVDSRLYVADGSGGLTVFDVTDGGLGLPAGVVATENAYPDRIGLSWKAVPGAGAYMVYRNDTTDPAGAVQVGHTTGTSYWDDAKSVVPGVRYYYWVRAYATTATNALQGGFSGAAAGRALDTMDMVLIPGGTFQMGIYKGRGGHAVTLSPFFMDEREVTTAEFLRFCQETGRPMPDALTNNAPWTASGANANLPMVNVTWNQAAAYAAWAGKRLPTEAEFEYVMRNGLADELYPWGQAAPAIAHHGDPAGQPTPAGAYAANTFGVYDIAGNVWEWCSDWFTNTLTGPAADPAGPATGVAKAIRGGSFACASNMLQCARRYELGPDARYGDVGFRCVYSIRSSGGGVPEMDADGDCIPDWWEAWYFGAGSGSPGYPPAGSGGAARRGAGGGIDPYDDADNDGMANWKEYVAGTVPTDRRSQLRISGGAVNMREGVSVVCWEGVPGKTYTIERSAHPARGFVTVASGIPGDRLNVYTDPVRGLCPLFYRIRVEE